MPTLPLSLIRTLSLLPPARSTRSWLLRVETMPPLLSAPTKSSCKPLLPLTSIKAAPSRCMVKAWPGALVPMPTLTSVVAPFRPLILPSTRLLLWVTEARFPMAVALAIPGAPFADLPTNVFPLSAVLEMPALVPTKVFSLPDMLLKPALPPKKALELPKVFPEPALCPNKELLFAVVLAEPANSPKKALKPPDELCWPAEAPKKEFRLPVALVKPADLPKKALPLPVALLTPESSPKKALLSPVVFEAPAAIPKKEFLEPVVLAIPANGPAKRLDTPGVLSTLLPPMLYCVVALRMLPVSVPP